MVNYNFLKIIYYSYYYSKMNKNNYKKRISENNNNKNYFRCASVEERYNKDSRFSKNLEKEYLDIKFLVKNSVEKINTLFNNEEFKHKTTSKKTYNNSNRININRLDFNKISGEIEEDKKKESKSNILKNYINVSTKEKSKNKKSDLNIKYPVNEEDEYTYNNNDLFEELKNLNSNKINKNNFNNRNRISKNNIFNETDSINGCLLSLESNKLNNNKEQSKDQSLTLKKLNLSETTNKNKKYKNQNTSNYLKTDVQNDILSFRERKKDNQKYPQKASYKFKKKNHNNNENKTRNINKAKQFSDKNPQEDTNKFSKTLKLNSDNNSLPKDTSLGNKNNSNNVLIDINLNINTEDNNEKEKKEENNLVSPLAKNNHKFKKRTNSAKEEATDTSYKNKFFNEKIKKIKKINENNSINKPDSKQINEKIDKIKIKDYMRMMLMLNEYIISNNLFEDYSNPESKKIIENYNLFLTNNININYESKIEVKDDKIDKKEENDKDNKNKENDKNEKDNKDNKDNKELNDNKEDKNNKENNANNDNKIIKAAIVIQRRWRKSKLDKYLINNFIEEEDELRKMLLNKLMDKPKSKDIKIIDIFNNVINSFKMVYKNIDEVEKIFYYIQKIIQRKLNIYEKNLLYKEYINKIIYNK